MKKYKMLAGAIGIGLSVLSLSSCVLKNKDLSIDRELEYTFTEEDYQNLKSEMERFERELSGNSALDLVGAWNTINRDTYAIATYRTVENVNYSQTGSQESYDKYIYFQDILNEVMKWQESMYLPIYNSQYKEEFYQGMTEEEIDELIKSVKPEKYYEIEMENEALLKQYDDLSTEEMSTKTSDIYRALVKNYQEEANLFGYSNYMDYAYKNIYNREYTPEDLTSFNENVRDYIVPVIRILSYRLEEPEEELSYNEKQQIQNITSSYYGEYRNLFNEYAAVVGGKYKENYDFLWKEGYIKEGNDSEKSLPGAYTTYLYLEELDQPIMYFGPGYQNVLTLVHEFGHYNAFCVNGPGEMSYDLAEIQSQGDELLFISWLKNANKMSENAAEYLADYSVYEACVTILMASVINEFEYRVYHAESLEGVDFDQIYRDSFEVFGGYSMISKLVFGDFGETTEYWKRVALDNPCYYISYAMSAVPSLELYAKAKNNVNLGIQIYSKVYDYDESYKQTNFKDIILAAGLSDPLTSDPFAKIAGLYGWSKLETK